MSPGREQEACIEMELEVRVTWDSHRLDVQLLPHDRVGVVLDRCADKWRLKDVRTEYCLTVIKNGIPVPSPDVEVGLCETLQDLSGPIQAVMDVPVGVVEMELHRLTEREKECMTSVGDFAANELVKQLVVEAEERSLREDGGDALRQPSAVVWGSEAGDSVVCESGDSAGRVASSARPKKYGRKKQRDQIIQSKSLSQVEYLSLLRFAMLGCAAPDAQIAAEFWSFSGDLFLRTQCVVALFGGKKVTERMLGTLKKLKDNGEGCGVVTKGGILMAAAAGRTDLLRALKNIGFDDFAVRKWCALHLAVDMGRIGTVRFLLEEAAAVGRAGEQIHSQERSLLLGPVKSGDLPILECLVAKGADRESPLENGCNALAIAAMQGHMDCVAFLSKGRDAAYPCRSLEQVIALNVDGISSEPKFFNISVRKIESAIRILLPIAGQDLLQGVTLKHSVLLSCIRKLSPTAFRYVLKYLPSSCRNEQLMMMAVELCAEEGLLCCLVELKRSGVSVASGRNYPLRLASWAGNHAVVEWLLKEGSSLTDDDYYPVRVAASHGWMQTIEIMLESAADTARDLCVVLTVAGLVRSQQQVASRALKYLAGTLNDYALCTELLEHCCRLESAGAKALLKVIVQEDETIGALLKSPVPSVKSRVILPPTDMALKTNVEAMAFTYPSELPLGSSFTLPESAVQMLVQAVMVRGSSLPKAITTATVHELTVYIAIPMLLFSGLDIESILNLRHADVSVNSCSWAVTIDFLGRKYNFKERFVLSYVLSHAIHAQRLCLKDINSPLLGRVADIPCCQEGARGTGGFPPGPQGYPLVCGYCGSVFMRKHTAVSLNACIEEALKTSQRNVEVPPGTSMIEALAQTPSNQENFPLN